MYCGNVGPLAGIEVLIDGFVKANITRSRLVVAGAGSARESLKVYAAKQQGHCIEFWDVPSGKVPEVQAQSDVMCLPVKKGFAMSSIPSKLPAYMFSAKPVLACVDSESDTALCIKESHAGWLCEPENVVQVAEQMQKICTINKDELNNMGTEGREYALKEFSRTENLKVLANACKEIINKE